MGVAWSLAALGLNLKGSTLLLVAACACQRPEQLNRNRESPRHWHFCTLRGRWMRTTQIARRRSARKWLCRGELRHHGSVYQYVAPKITLLIDAAAWITSWCPFNKWRNGHGNTKPSRSPGEQRHNRTCAQCEEGWQSCRSVLPGLCASDVSSAQLEAHKLLLSEIVYRRCRHVISEQAGDADGRSAQSGDMQEVGLDGCQPQQPACDDYGVSSRHWMSWLRRCAVFLAVCARLTGAGFGGCAIALVEPGKEQNVADAIFERYPKVTNIWPEVYTSPASAGARIESIA